MISNQLVTAFINPDNLPPDATNGQLSYFSQPELLDRVPKYFLTFGSISFCSNIVGIMFMRTKKNSDNSKAKSENDEKCTKVDMIHSGEENEKRMNVDSQEARIEDCRERQSVEQSYQDEGNGTVSSNNTDNTSKEKDITPMEAIKCFPFYAIALAILFSDCAFCIIPNYYKTFGLIYIPDDHLMTNIGTVTVASIAICTFVSGIVGDHLELKMSLVVSTTVMIVISAFYFFTPNTSPIMFAIAPHPAFSRFGIF